MSTRFEERLAEAGRMGWNLGEPHPAQDDGSLMASSAGAAELYVYETGNFTVTIGEGIVSRGGEDKSIPSAQKVYEIVYSLQEVERVAQRKLDELVKRGRT
jgi:hypothetical protein